MRKTTQGTKVVDGFLYVNTGLRGIDSEGLWRLVIPQLMRDPKGEVLVLYLLKKVHEDTLKYLLT